MGKWGRGMWGYNLKRVLREELSEKMAFESKEVKE